MGFGVARTPGAARSAWAAGFGWAVGRLVGLWGEDVLGDFDHGPLELPGDDDVGEDQEMSKQKRPGEFHRAFFCVNQSMG